MAANSRRVFLKQSVVTTISLAVANPLQVLCGSFNKQLTLPAWTDLIDYARWCPTVHNLQPHKIKIISNTEASLYYAPARLLPVGDPDCIFVTVAMGIFHEHLSIAAAFYGYAVSMTNISSPIKTQSSKHNTFFATLKLIPAAKKENLQRNLMLKRKTSRRHYNGDALKAGTLAQLKNEAEGFDHDFFSTSQPQLINDIVALNQQTLFQDISVDADRKELDALFRYSRKEAETHKDGLWSKCMGFPGVLMKSVFEHPHKWNKGLKKKLLAKNYEASFKGTATLCWFGGRFNNTEDWLQAGRMLARNWLLLTKEGAYLQPFGSLITNAKAYEKINTLFTQPGNGKKIWMIFRAGYSKEPARSFRLSTSEIIIPS